MANAELLAPWPRCWQAEVLLEMWCCTKPSDFLRSVGFGRAE